jgi:hypothetical protein
VLLENSRCFKRMHHTTTQNGARLQIKDHAPTSLSPRNTVVSHVLLDQVLCIYNQQGAAPARCARSGTHSPRARRRAEPCPSAAAMRASTLHKLPGAHAEGIWCATWIPGTASLLTGSVDEHVKMWDAAAEPQPTAQHTFSGYSLGAVSLSVDASGQYAACRWGGYRWGVCGCGDLGFLRRRCLQQPAKKALHAALRPRGPPLLPSPAPLPSPETLTGNSALDSVVRVWDPAAAESKFNIESLPTESWGVAFGPVTGDAMRVAVAGGSKEAVTIYRGGAEEPVAEATLALPPVGGAGQGLWAAELRGGLQGVCRHVLGVCTARCISRASSTFAHQSGCHGRPSPVPVPAPLLCSPRPAPSPARLPGRQRGAQWAAA